MIDFKRIVGFLLRITVGGEIWKQGDQFVGFAVIQLIDGGLYQVSNRRGG